MTTERQARVIIAERCGGRCERCGAPQYTVHHRRKKSQGGPWEPANLLALCGSGTTGCHGFVEANPKFAHDMGYWLRHGEHYELTAVWLWGRWMLPPNDGGPMVEVDAKDLTQVPA